MSWMQDPRPWEEVTHPEDPIATPIDPRERLYLEASSLERLALANAYKWQAVREFARCGDSESCARMIRTREPRIDPEAVCPERSLTAWQADLARRGWEEAVRDCCDRCKRPRAVCGELYHVEDEAGGHAWCSECEDEAAGLASPEEGQKGGLPHE